jgi:hypothetical protein
MDTSLQTEKTISFHSFGGWALQKSATLDKSGCRGLVADLTTASILKRQSAFAVLATVDLDNSCPFLNRLGMGQSGVGEAIQSRLAKDLISAAFGRPVPGGYLRALQRIGYKPLERPHLYRRLFEIFTDEAEKQKAHALRFCGPIDATRIEIVDALDPVLVHPEILKRTRNVAKAHEANDLIHFLKQVCSSATDEALVAGLSIALETGDLDEFAQGWMEKADQLPPPPFLSQDGVIALTSAAAMIETGKFMNNCLDTKVAEVALGLAYFYWAEVAISNEVSIPVVVELQPMSNGTWAVSEIHGKGNRPPTSEVKAALVKRLLRLGAVVAGNPAVHPRCRDLTSHFNVFRYGPFETFALEDEPNELEAMMDQIAAEFGLEAA